MDFNRTLDPIFARLEKRPAKPPRLAGHLVRLGRELRQVFAWCVWQAAVPVLCTSVLVCGGLLSEQWEALGMRRAIRNEFGSRSTAVSPAAISSEWRLPGRWNPSGVYQPDEEAKKNHVKLYGWSYGNTGFLLVQEVPMTEAFKRLYETNPGAFVTEVMNVTNQKCGLSAGPAKWVEAGGRSWLEAEFTDKHFDATWRADTSWLRLFTPGSMGIQRTTIGPEGLTTVVALTPPTTFPLLREPLRQILNSVQIGARNREREAASDIMRWPSHKETLTSALQLEPKIQTVAFLPEMELELPSGWVAGDAGSFRFAETADLVWSFRPVELSDESSRSAAERDFRRAQLADGVEYADPRWSKSGKGVTVECESRHRWMVQHTTTSNSGVISGRKRHAW